jgi:hypothetical protein
MDDDDEFWDLLDDLTADPNDEEAKRKLSDLIGVTVEDVVPPDD